MADNALSRYERLDQFLKKLGGDVYPEVPSDLHTAITRKVIDRLFEVCPQPEGARVLDIGCGQGVALEVFQAKGLRPVGITLGEDAAVCRARGYEVFEMDQSFLEFGDAEFDLLWCRHALEHSIFPYFTLSEFFRVLKPGGVLYVEVPAPDTACNHQNNPNHYSVLGRSMWFQLLHRSGFEVAVQFDIGFDARIGPDVYWAFICRRPAA